MTQATAHIDTSTRTSVRFVCLATHHKEGTIWMKQIVKSLSTAWNIPWIGIWSERQLGAIPDQGAALLVNWNGYFPKQVWDNPDAAFVHVIRDPRDILLSGCQYHHYAGPKGERFLHTPLDRFDGLTYQEKLNSIDLYDDKLLFEMEGNHADTVAEMRAWPVDGPSSVTLRYEDLMGDTEARLFSHGIKVWQLDETSTLDAAAAFYSNSLFGGAADTNQRVAQHVQSGSQNRWMREMPRSVGEKYAEHFGQDLIDLGYEKDTSWVEKLPETSTPFAIKAPTGAANVTVH